MRYAPDPWKWSIRCAWQQFSQVKRAQSTPPKERYLCSGFRGQGSGFRVWTGAEEKAGGLDVWLGARTLRAGSSTTPCARVGVAPLLQNARSEWAVTPPAVWRGSPQSLTYALSAVYKGTSLIRKRIPLGTYCRPMPRDLWGSYRDGRSPMGVVPLQRGRGKLTDDCNVRCGGRKSQGYLAHTKTLTL